MSFASTHEQELRLFSDEEKCLWGSWEVTGKLSVSASLRTLAQTDITSVYQLSEYLLLNCLPPPRKPKLLKIKELFLTKKYSISKALTPHMHVCGAASQFS